MQYHESSAHKYMNSTDPISISGTHETLEPGPDPQPGHVGILGGGWGPKPINGRSRHSHVSFSVARIRSSAS